MQELKRDVRCLTKQQSCSFCFCHTTGHWAPSILHQVLHHVVQNSVQTGPAYEFGCGYQLLCSNWVKEFALQQKDYYKESNAQNWHTVATL